MKKKLFQKMTAYVLSAALVVTAGAFSSTSAEAASKKASVKLSKKSATIEVGKKVTLKVKKTNVKKITKTKWSVKSKKVAKVSKKGVVTAVAAGKTTVTAKVTYLPKKGKKKTKSLKATITVKAKKTNTPSTVATQAPGGNATKAPGTNATTAPGGNATATPGGNATATPGGNATNTPAAGDATPTPAAGDATPTPPAGDATPTPAAGDATPTPAAGDATPTPAAGDATPTPPAGDATPTPPAGDATPTPAETSNPVQSLKITVKDVTDSTNPVILTNAVISIKDSHDKDVTVTKSADGVYTTEKLFAGNYTIKFAELTLEDGKKYEESSKKITITNNATGEQSVEILVSSLHSVISKWSGSYATYADTATDTGSSNNVSIQQLKYDASADDPDTSKTLVIDLGGFSYSKYELELAYTIDLSSDNLEDNYGISINCNDEDIVNSWKPEEGQSKISVIVTPDADGKVKINTGSYGYAEVVVTSTKVTGWIVSDTPNAKWSGVYATYADTMTDAGSSDNVTIQQLKYDASADDPDTSKTLVIDLNNLNYAQYELKLAYTIDLSSDNLEDNYGISINCNDEDIVNSWKPEEGQPKISVIVTPDADGKVKINTGSYGYAEVVVTSVELVGWK